jgi:hypothetical protein
MQNNIEKWSYHYEDILNDLFRSFRSFLLTNGEDEPDYDTFVEFCYENTRKTYNHNRDYIYAPII